MFLRKKLSVLLWLTAAPWLMNGSWAAAESKTFGDYEVFYSVFNSTFIKPSVARHYDITRGKDRAVLNIAVRKQLPKGESAPHAVEIRGESSDLIHSMPLAFREVREQDVIYYLAELTFRDKEVRSFTVRFKPDPAIAPYTLKFSKTLYVDK